MAVIVGGLGVAGQEAAQGRVMDTIALQQIFVGVKRGEQEGIAADPMGFHKSVGVAEFLLQFFQPLL